MPFVCSNPDCRHIEQGDPRGHCPACVTETSEDPSGWSMTPISDGPDDQEVAVS